MIPVRAYWTTFPEQAVQRAAGSEPCDSDVSWRQRQSNVRPSAKGKGGRSLRELGHVLRTRREVLVAGMAGVFGLALAACGGDTTRAAVSIPPAGSDLGAVEHVVFLMNENRSFDHYYGSYPGVRGFDDPTALPGVFSQQWDGAGFNRSATSLLPFHLDTATTDAECTYDLSHEWSAQHKCWNGGQMDRFVATHTSPQYEGPTNGVLTMGYYTRQDLPYWYSLADAFTICDNYHCSVMGPTHPNRLYAWSGTLDPAGEEGGPVIVTNSASSFIGSAKWRTMPEELQSKGVPWKVYNPAGSIYAPAFFEQNGLQVG